MADDGVERESIAFKNKQTQNRHSEGEKNKIKDRGLLGMGLRLGKQ